MQSWHDGYGDDTPTSGHIDDGFGEETPAQIVDRYRKWCHTVAGALVNASDALYDDLVQEAMISIWRTAKDKGDVGAVYFTKAARYRMFSVLQGRPLIGGDSTPGAKYRPTTVGVDWHAVENDAEDDSTWALLLEAADLLDAVDWAYHVGEITAVLNTLRPDHRRFVEAKYWHGMRDVEIAALMEVDRKLLNTWWRRDIKPVLQRELAHLGAP